MLFVRTLSDRDVQLNELPRNTFPDVRQALIERGVPASEAACVILSAQPFATRGPATSQLAATSDDMPPIPRPHSLGEVADSEPRTIATGPLQWMNLHIDGGLGGGSYINSAATSWSFGSFHFEPAVPQFRLTYQSYWHVVASMQITGPQTYTHEFTLKHGTSVTDTQTISAELGVSAKGLGASVSVTLSHSVTVTDETEATEKFEVPVAAGQVFLWTLWQPVHRLAIVNADGTTANYSGRMIFDSGMLSGLSPVSLVTNVADEYSPNRVADIVVLSS